MPPPRKVAWISEYPVEWMTDAPEVLRSLPKKHPATWMAVLMEQLAQEPEIELHVLVLRNNIERDVSFQRGGVSFYVLKVPHLVRAPSLFWVDTLVLSRALKKIRPDIVHAWGTERGAALVASRLGFPYLVTIQGLLSWYHELIPFTAYDRFAMLLEQVGLRRARLVTTESTFAVRYLKAKYRQLEVYQAEHAPNEIFQGIKRRPPTDVIHFICIGSLDYRKGSDLLLQGLDELTPEIQFDLLIVGSPNEWFNSLKARLSPRLLSRMYFKTNLLPMDVAEELSVATIKVLPTRADTSPNAVKEAVVAGVPVVASDIGGIPDYVFPGQNGFLFRSTDLRGLVSTLRQATQHPLFGQGRVEPSCLSRTRIYLSPERMKQRFLAAYRRVQVEAL